MTPSNKMNANHYLVLGCKQDASYEEIKAKYHKLAKVCHPDRGERKQYWNYTFIDIDAAWKTLRDPDKRKIYDEELRKEMLEQPNIIYGTFKLDELNYDVSTRTYSCFCKCGGIYNFSVEGCEEFNSCLIGCEECSLMISVNFW